MCYLWYGLGKKHQVPLLEIEELIVGNSIRGSCVPDCLLNKSNQLQLTQLTISPSNYLQQKNITNMTNSRPCAHFID